MTSFCKEFKMHFRCAAVLLFICFHSSECQSLMPCKYPEKHAPCVLTCITKDFDNPVTFSHPARVDVGSCISKNQCESFNKNYNISQRIRNNKYLTELKIHKLDRQRDESDWFCAYGNLPSRKASLTIYTKPIHVEISVNDSYSNHQELYIECTCACLFSLLRTSMKITASDGNRTLSRSTGPMKTSKMSETLCFSNEIAGSRTIKINKTRIIGASVQINCECIESNLEYEIQNGTTFIDEDKTKSHTEKYKKSYFATHWKILIAVGTYLVFSVLFSWIIFRFFRSCLWKKNASDKYGTENRNKGGTETEMRPLKDKDENDVETAQHALEWIEVSKESADENDLRRSKLHKKRCIIFLSIVFVVLSFPIVTAVTVQFDKAVSDSLIIITVSLLSSIIPLAPLCIILYRERKQDEKRGTRHKDSKRHSKGARIKDSKRHSKDVISSNGFHLDKEWNEVSAKDIVKIEKIIEKDKGLSQMVKDGIDAFCSCMRSQNNQRLLKTKVFDEGTLKLKQFEICVFKGIEGCGKTINALHLMVHWFHKGHYPVIFETLEHLNEMLESNVKVIILMENILHSLQNLKMNLNEKLDLLSKVFNGVKKSRGKIKIILTFTTSILEQESEEWSWLHSAKLLDQIHIINYSDKKFRLKQDQKVKLLSAYCEMNDIMIYSQKEDEHYHRNLKSLETGQDYLSMETVQEISNVEPMVGFAKCCVDFPDHIKMGIDFFMQPPVSLVKTLLTYRDSKNEVNKMKYQILESVFLGNLNPNDEKEHFTVIGMLKKDCIEKGDGGHFGFKCSAIETAVCLCLGKTDPRAVLEKCSWNFIQYYVRSEHVNGDDMEWMTLILDEEGQSVLIERFLQLSRDSVTKHFHYVSGLGKSFLKALFGSIQKKKKYNLVLGPQGQNGIFADACYNGNEGLVQELWQYFKSEIQLASLIKLRTNIKSDKRMQDLLQTFIEKKDPLVYYLKKTF